MIHKYFHPVTSSSFIILPVSFIKCRFLILIKLNLSNLSAFLMDHVFGVMLKNTLKGQGCGERKVGRHYGDGFEDKLRQ